MCLTPITLRNHRSADCSVAPPSAHLVYVVPALHFVERLIDNGPWVPFDHKTLGQCNGDGHQSGFQSRCGCADGRGPIAD